MSNTITRTQDLGAADLDRVVARLFGCDPKNFHPSTCWMAGGPLLTADDGRVITVYEDPHWNQGVVGTERYLATMNIGVEDKQMSCGSSQTGAWTTAAATFRGDHTCSGSTYLEAAMRCLVTSLLGPFVDVDSAVNN